MCVGTLIQKTFTIKLNNMNGWIGCSMKDGGAGAGWLVRLGCVVKHSLSYNIYQTCIWTG